MLIAQLFVFIIEAIFLIIWGITLIRLNRKFKAADSLMPNAKIFCMHATVLIAYLGFYLGFIIFFMMAEITEGKTSLIMAGIDGVVGCLYVIFECAGYWLVLAMMFPLTKSQRGRREDFQAFLLFGYKNTDELKSAIYQLNDDMTFEEKQEFEESMQ